jgi:hypothetical protein
MPNEADAIQFYIRPSARKLTKQNTVYTNQVFKVVSCWHLHKQMANEVFSYHNMLLDFCGLGDFGDPGILEQDFEGNKCGKR